jgi:hypothetical protein
VAVAEAGAMMSVATPAVAAVVVTPVAMVVAPAAHAAVVVAPAVVVAAPAAVVAAPAAVVVVAPIAATPAAETRIAKAEPPHGVKKGENDKRNCFESTTIEKMKQRRSGIFRSRTKLRQLQSDGETCVADKLPCDFNKIDSAAENEKSDHTALPHL